MMFTDTHAHLTEPALYGRLQQISEQAAEQGVRRFIVPSARPSDWPSAALLHERAGIYAAFGIHPWFAAEYSDQDFAVLQTLLEQHPAALVGETGLDYRRAVSANERALQNRALLRHIRLAAAFKRPLIVHNVSAGNDLIQLLKKEKFRCGGFAHAFSGSLEEAREWMKLGFKIGIGSLLLNPNAKKVRRAAAELPLEHIVLETDSPFMLRDTVNTPSNIRRIAEITAELRGIDINTLSEQTEKNVDEVLDFAP